MTVDFPRRDADTNQLVMVTHYTVDELADMLHVSRASVHRKCQTGAWPHLDVLHTRYFAPEHVERIVELLTVDPDALPEYGVTDPPRLGVVSDPVDDEPLQ